jgi:hypothetical protein
MMDMISLQGFTFTVWDVNWWMHDTVIIIFTDKDDTVYLCVEPAQQTIHYSSLDCFKTRNRSESN